MKVKNLIKNLAMRRDVPLSSYDIELNILDCLLFCTFIYNISKFYLNVAPIITAPASILLSAALYYLFTRLYIGHILNIIFSGIWATLLLYILPIVAFGNNNTIVKIVAWLILYILCLMLRFNCTPIKLKTNLNWKTYDIRIVYEKMYEKYKSSTNSYYYRGASANSESNSNKDTGRTEQDNSNTNQERNQQQNNTYTNYSTKKEFHSDYFEDCKSRQELDARYRFLVKHFHPDQQNGNEMMFKMIQEHYEKLKEIYQ